MQIRLSARNQKKILELMGIYRKTCPDYDVSTTFQTNLLLAGRLDVAILEAKKDLKSKRCCRA
jgi:hypothetical protein